MEGFAPLVEMDSANGFAAAAAATARAAGATNGSIFAVGDAVTDNTRAIDDAWVVAAAQ